MDEGLAGERVAIARHLLTTLVRRVMPPMERAVGSIPADRLDFRPTPDVMSLKEMAYHPYQGAFILVSGAVRGRSDPEDEKVLPVKPEEARTPGELVAYGRAVREYLSAAVDDLTEEGLGREVEYHFGLRIRALDAVCAAYDEVLHHRGQLATYLRLVGVKPPDLFAPPSSL